MKATLDLAIKETWNAIYKMYNQLASEYGGNYTIGNALICIDKVNGTPSTALAPMLGMEPASLTRTLKTMEDKGLIYKEKNPNDGRSVLIFLSDLGLEKRELSKQIIFNFNDALEEKVSPEELAYFMEICEKINDVTKEYTETNKTLAIYG